MSMEELVKSLYLARRYADKKRITRAAVRVGVGPCELLNEHGKGPCWHSEPDKWCGPCAAVKPYHDAYRAASSKAGTALRRVLREGKRLAEEKEPKSENRGIRHLYHPLARSMMQDMVELLEKRIANKGQYLSETVEDAIHDLNVLVEARLHYKARGDLKP